MSSRMKIIIACLCVVLLLGGVLALFFWPAAPVEEIVPSASPTPSLPPLLEVDKASVSSLRLSPPVGTPFSLVPIESGYRLEAQEDAPLAPSASYMGSAFTNALSLKATRLVEESPSAERLAAYGLNPAAGRVELTLKDGTSAAVDIGSPTPAGDGYYAKRTDAPEVVLISTTAARILLRGEDEYYDYQLFGRYPMDDGQGGVSEVSGVYAFGVLSLIQPDGTTSLSLERRDVTNNWSENSVTLYQPYLFTAPFVGDGDLTAIEKNLLPGLESLAPNQVLLRDTSRDAELGLDNPTTMELYFPAQEETRRLYIGGLDPETGGRCLRMEGSDWVFLDTAGNYAFLTQNPYMMRSSMFINSMIIHLQSVDISISGQFHRLTLEQNKEDKDLASAQLNGRDITIQQAKDLYMQVLSLLAQGWSTGDAAAPVTHEIILTHEDGSQRHFEFRPGPEQRFSAFEDGVDLGCYVGTAKFEAVLDMAAEILG